MNTWDSATRKKKGTDSDMRRHTEFVRNAVALVNDNNKQSGSAVKTAQTNSSLGRLHWINCLSTPSHNVLPQAIGLFYERSTSTLRETTNVYLCPPWSNTEDE